MDLSSDQPFWPLNSGLIRSYPALESDLACEVLVLGAGLTGALCALHLTKAGMNRAMPDQRDVASGGLNAGLAIFHYEIDMPLTDLVETMGRADAERSYQACLESIGKIAALREEVGDSFPSAEYGEKQSRSVW
jgi:glycine/D-amino acid oxidase-like deaminating enzyme